MPVDVTRPYRVSIHLCADTDTKEQTVARGTCLSVETAQNCNLFLNTQFQTVVVIPPSFAVTLRPSSSYLAVHWQSGLAPSQ